MLRGSVSAADLEFPIDHVAVRHRDRFSDEVARGSGGLGGDIPFCVIGRRGEGRRSADYEPGSRRSKKQIFHDTVLSLGSRLAAALVMIHVSFRHYCRLMKDHLFMLVFTLPK
jgi:hypothetical protein